MSVDHRLTSSSLVKIVAWSNGQRWAIQQVEIEAMFTCTCPREIWLGVGCKCGAMAAERKEKQLRKGSTKTLTAPGMTLAKGDQVRVSKRTNTTGDYANLTYEEWVMYNGEVGVVSTLFEDPDGCPRNYALMDFDRLPSVPIPIDCLRKP